ncbi:MAG: alpha/beta hydrolase [Candidatus Nanopelagicales bacterium]
MRHDEQTHRTADGASVFWQQWFPDTDPVGVVCLVHGLGEHSSRYGYVAQRLTDAGLAVYALDLRGHGHSGGTRGDLRVDDAVADIAALVAAAQTDYPGLPVILYGHSLGGLLTMTYVVRRRPDVAGMVASAPALDSELREQKVKFTMANILGGIVPGVTIPTGLDPNGVSRDPEVVAAYTADPLVHDKGSLALAKQTFSAMDDMMAQKTFPIPLLIIHGTADPLTVPSASRVFADNTEGDITLIEYDGMFHEPHNEPEKEQVLDDVLAWITPRLG